MHIYDTTLLTAKSIIQVGEGGRLVEQAGKRVHKNEHAHTARASRASMAPLAKMSERISFKSNVSTMFLAALSLCMGRPREVICLPVTMLLHPENEGRSSHRIHNPTVTSQFWADCMEVTNPVPFSCCFKMDLSLTNLLECYLPRGA